MTVGRLHRHNFPLDTRSNGLLLPRDVCLIIAGGILAFLVRRLAILELVEGARALRSYNLIKRLSGAVRRFDLGLLQLASAFFVTAGHYRIALG